MNSIANISAYGLTRENWESRVAPASHVKTIMQSLYQTGKFPTATLPRHLPDQLNSNYHRLPLKIHAALTSNYDSSVKFVFELQDGLKVEAVLMPESKRTTLCLSTQVGCAQGCVFCHTGRMGLLRNLTVQEIILQVVTAKQWLQNSATVMPPLKNIVFMGMGEPLDNSENLGKAWEILTDPWSFGFGPKHISVSTAGHLEGLKILSSQYPAMRFALSLHSPYSAERSKIMPINKRFDIKEVLHFMKESVSIQKNGLLIQYTLIEGVNDSEAHALETIGLLDGLNVKINIIPLNPIDPSRLRGPSHENLWFFWGLFHKNGIRAMVRFSKGQDIAAACGQLVQTPEI